MTVNGKMRKMQKTTKNEVPPGPSTSQELQSSSSPKIFLPSRVKKVKMERDKDSLPHCYSQSKPKDKTETFDNKEISKMSMRSFYSLSKDKMLHGSSQFNYNSRNSIVDSKDASNKFQESNIRENENKWKRLKSQEIKDEIEPAEKDAVVQTEDNRNQSTIIKYNAYRRLQSSQQDTNQNPQYRQNINTQSQFSSMRRNDEVENNYDPNMRRRDGANYHRNSQKLDFIIFGATGSLGSYTVLSAANVFSQYSWGVAGRNRSRLEDVIRNVEAMTNTNLRKVSISVVDANDRSALESMAGGCQVLINCCGPYSSTAKAVIEACINSGTHYVDACMEPVVLKKLRETFNSQAERQQVYIINSCGFSSFAIDVGINYVEDIFAGDVYEVEAYTQFCANNGGVNTPITSVTAFQAFISAFATASETLNKKFECGCVANVPKVCYGVPIKKTEVNSGVSIPMPFIETQTVHETQKYLHDKERKPPIQFRNYLTFPSFLAAFLALIWCAILFVLSQAPRSRELLLMYPKFFSLGLCTNDCLEKPTMENLMFSVTLVAHGFKDPNQRNPNRTQCTCHQGNESRNYNFNNSVMPRTSITPSARTTPEGFSMQRKEKNKEVKAKISGNNPIYGFGCIALLSSAITVIRDAERLPKNGGVYTPGAAFRNTDVLQEVANHDNKYRYREI